MLACRIIGLQILPHGDVLAGLTPIVNVNADQFDARLGSFTMTLKLEQLQHAGSFKTRGAFATRRSRTGSTAQWGVRARARRASRRPGQRRQHHRRRFQRSLTAPRLEHHRAACKERSRVSSNCMYG
jgi:hypothetical protein